MKRNPQSTSVTLFLVVLLAAVAPCRGAVNRWETLGLHSTVPLSTLPTTNSHIGVHPTDASILYVGNEAGVWKTSDAGASWALVFEDRIGGPNPSARPVLGLELDAGDPSTVFAVTTDSIQRTTTAGVVWSPVYASDGVSALSPVLPGAAIFTCATDTPNGPRVTLKSDDRGSTWVRVPGLDGKIVKGFAIDRADPRRVWAAVNLDPQSVAVYASEDGGETWEPRGAGITTLRMEDVVVDPDTPGTLYASTTDAGVFRTEDGGANWVPASNGLPSSAIIDLIAGPDSSVYAATRLDGIFRSLDGGGHWLPAGFRGWTVGGIGLDASGPTLYAGIIGGVLRITWAPTAACVSTAENLCLQGERFSVGSSWRTPNDADAGQAVPLTSDTGYFWFFAPENVELTVKVLDGHSVNEQFWVFYGALSDVEYAITVMDTRTGAVQSYFNLRGILASVADTSAFPVHSGTATLDVNSVRRIPRPVLADACAPGAFALCLNEGRFRVEVFFTRTPSGPTLPAPVVPLTSDTGYFWFFDEVNVELVVKVLDGRSVNGHFWVFYGALSDVEYTVTVTDTQTGTQRTYENLRGSLASVADTSAF